MKLLRASQLAALLFVSLSAAAAFAASPAATPKPKTYAVLGFVDGARPTDELLGQALREVAKKMQGRVLVQSPEDADHVVQILFRRGGYKVYVDALPLDSKLSREAMERFASDFAYRQMIATERKFEGSSRR